MLGFISIIIECYTKLESVFQIFCKDIDIIQVILIHNIENVDSIIYVYL